jgi:hypothetical protein
MVDHCRDLRPQKKSGSEPIVKERQCDSPPYSVPGRCYACWVSNFTDTRPNPLLAVRVVIVVVILYVHSHPHPGMNAALEIVLAL